MTKNMKKTLVLAVSMVALSTLAGCEKETKETTNAYQMPAGMEDCKVYIMRGSDGNNMIVVRCPNSSTTTRSGKATNVTVVDGAAPIENKVPQEVPKNQNTNEVQINGETYRKSESMKQIEINGQTYKKVQ